MKKFFATGLTLSQEDALRAQIFGCWSVPWGYHTMKIICKNKTSIKKRWNYFKVRNFRPPKNE